METFIQLNNYNDLEALSDMDLEIDHLSKEFKYIGRIPGYSYYTNLIKYRDETYLMITKDYKKIFYFRCIFNLSAYENIALEFGFIPNKNNKYFFRSKDFNEHQEKRFIEKLLNLNKGKNFIAKKYGLK